MSRDIGVLEEKKMLEQSFENTVGTSAYYQLNQPDKTEMHNSKLSKCSQHVEIERTIHRTCVTYAAVHKFPLWLKQELKWSAKLSMGQENCDIE